MSKHVHEWLNAYLDGQLQGSRLQHVEAHLVECSTCQAELVTLEKLSRIVKEVPGAQLTSPERLAAQVILRLPPTQIVQVRTRILEIGWWMIPVGLLAAWIFFSTSFFMRDILSAAGALGWLPSVSGWLADALETQAFWSTTLGQLGILSGNSLDLAASTEVITRSSLLQISLQTSIALLYLGWIAILWARHTHQGHGRLIEG